MNLAELFIRRPVMTTLIMLGIGVFGVLSYRTLPLSDLPNVDFPTIQVSAGLPGASAQTMASAVALPLEKQFSTIQGIKSINSTSAQGATSITLQFDLSRNIDAAAQDVQSMIAKAERQLPPDMPTPPSYQKVNPADQPVVFLALQSNTLPLSTVDEYAETTVAPQISTIPGVAQVGVFGEQKYAVRIDLNPRELASRQIGLDEVAAAVQASNVNTPTGILNGPRRTFTVQTNSQLFDAAAYRPLIIAYRNGSPVRLDQVARVYNGVEDDKVGSWYKGIQTIFLAVQKQPGANTVEVVDAVKKLLPHFKTELPAAVSLVLRSDRSITIRNSVSDVKLTLQLAVCLVILVIFLFLRNVSATLIPSLALPASILATFSVMYLLGYSLDNLSLMALTLSVGFLVDDAIVMLENIVRHMEQGKTAMQAALDGSKEIIFTILSMTLSLTAVFIPVLFMGGILGRLLHEFAVTIGAAILVSGFVSLSLTPMLCSRFLRPPKHEGHGLMYRALERVFEGALALYKWTLAGALKYRAVTFAISVVLLGITGYLFVIIPKGFIPTEDQNQISASTQAAEGIGYQAMVAHQMEVAAVIGKDPNVIGFSNHVGAGGPNNTSNMGRMFIDLKPRDERKLSADQVIDELRPKLAKIPGIRVFLQNPPAIQIGGHMTKSMYQFTLQSTNTAQLFRYAPLFEARLKKTPGLVDVTSDLQIKNPQVNVHIDRNKVSTMGLTVDQVDTALYTAFGTRQVSTIYAPNDQFKVIMQVAPRYQNNPSELSDLYVRSSDGTLVPLSAVTTTRIDAGPLTVNHTGQLPSVTVSFNLAPGEALGNAVSAVQAAARAVLPASITTSFQGTAQAFQDSLKGLGIILLMAIVVIYIVLGILYESFIHPLTILSALPAAGFGALVTLMIFHTDLNLFSFVGVIMLVGLVKKNGIMMIDFALATQRSRDVSPVDAIYEACQIRFRPIMMTTMSALVGTLPIALGVGPGANARRPLGLAVVGGLMVSQLLTLYITPVYYVYLEGLRQRLSRRRRTRRPAVTAGAPLPQPTPPGTEPAMGYTATGDHPGA